MNDKIARIKTKIKHHVPELIVATTVVAGVASVIYLIKHNPADGEKLIALDHGEWEMFSAGESLYVETDYGMAYMHLES